MYDHADQLKEFAEHLASHAAHLIWTDRLRAAGGPYRGAHRTPAGLLSPAALGAERLIREMVAYHRPDDAVLGGEHVARSGQIIWVVDPLNGTTNYLGGLPCYGVSVAAALDDVVLAGAVAEPHSRRVWSAGLGQGARLYDPTISEDWLEIRVAATQHLHDAVISTGYSDAGATRAGQAALIAQLAPQVGTLRTIGSAAVQLCHVAAGWADAYVEHGIGLRERAAGLLIADEAGATVHHPGQPGPGTRLGDPVFAAAPRISDALLDALALCGAADVVHSADRPHLPAVDLPRHTA
ncbi:MAG: monophosphatase [Pseudonocardiales bacterium]|jgi:myo-inositol-1(or 4)-monophosphatase|nr:monophosphatase [Pseudonocardiales bacterium]